MERIRDFERTLRGPARARGACRPARTRMERKRPCREGKKIDLVYRRVLINDIVARPKECAALVKAYEAQAVCVANNFRCKIPHVKAFFAVLTDQKNAKLFSPDELDVIRQHVPWTRVVEDVKTDYQGKPIALLDYIRKNQKDLVVKTQRRIRRNRRNAWVGSERQALGKIDPGSSSRRDIGERARLLDCAGKDRHAARRVPLHRRQRKS